MFIFLDTETTGNGHDDRIFQIAFKTEKGEAVNELFNPGMPITIDAMTVHHITNEMVRDKPGFRNSDIWKQLQDVVNSEGAVMVAHNAGFDVDMLKKEGIEPKNVICTLKLARYFDKDGVIPKYGLQYLRYYLSLMSLPLRIPPWGIFLSLRRFLTGFTQKRLSNLGMMPFPR